VALEHKLLIIIYHVLHTRKPYRDLGAEYFDRLEKKLYWLLGPSVL